MNKNLWNRIIRTVMPKIDETEPENGIIKEFQDKTKLFRLNRLLSDRRVVLCLALALPVVILLTGNYLYNICTASLQAAFSVFQNESTHISFGLENCFRFPSSSGYYVLIVLLILILEIVLPYKIRTSYKDFNVGQKGTERWATTEELRQQYVAVPERDQCFDGAGGVPISWDRERNEILIDRSAVNNYIIGTTRSGKGESYLFTAIDIYSRASIKPSLILCDPKLEVYKMSSKTLRKRGFIPILLNLSDPLHSSIEEIRDWMSKNLMTISKITTQYNVSRTTLLYRMRLFNIKPFITFDRIHLYLVSDLERVMSGKEKEES